MHDYPLEQRTFGHMLADKALRVGERTCLIFGERRFTYAQAHDLTNSYANAFAAFGVKKGDHVATMLGNCPELVWVYWGLSKLGAVNVPLNTAARGDLLRYFVEQSQSRFVVVAREWSGRIAASIAGNEAIRGCCTLGGADPALAASGLPLAAVEEFETASAEARCPDLVNFSDPQFIMYTSGTTGPSKGVMSPHTQGHAVGRHLAQQFGYTPDDVIYTCLPLFHGNALWYSCFAAFWADAALAISPRYSASGFWDEIRATGATQFNALGAMTNILLKAEPSPQERDHKVRQAMVIPLSRESYQAVSQRFGVQITSLYAMTETFPVTMFVPGDPEDKRSSAGKPRGLAEVRIVDDEDRPLGPGETGEICVRPIEPWIMMLGYYNMPEATLRDTRNLWLHTGDRGYLDGDGYLFFVDRKKEAIRRRGENISAYEVEMLVAKHPGVREVAAVPVSSELSEDEVMVFVVAASAPPTEEELIRFCNDHMAHFMVPRFVHFIDALPKTATEKIEKYKLKTWAEENRASLWDRDAQGIKLTR